LRRMADVSPYKAFVRPSNASNNEASAHAYNPKGREKKVHIKLDIFLKLD
jgi:hypothetical protein